MNENVVFCAAGTPMCICYSIIPLHSHLITSFISKDKSVKATLVVPASCCL